MLEGHESFYGEDRGDLRSFTRAVIGAGADLVLGHGPHVLRGMEVVDGRLVVYSMGNFATYGRFDLSGPLGFTVLLEVSLAEDGRFAGGKLVPTKQEGKGVPFPDDTGRGAKLVRQLTQADFPKTGVRIDEASFVVSAP